MLKWRDEFPILQDSIYLINNSLGAMPRRAYRALEEYADAWNRRGIAAWEHGWWEMPVVLGDLVGEILGSPPGSVSMHQNVTLAEAVVFSCLRPTSERNRIVYSELNFPSVRYFYQAQENVEVVAVPCPDGVTVPLQDLLEAIDERTLAVPISHVIFKSSALQDVPAIVKKAHAVGARVILDCYQSCGALPFNVVELGVDFAIGGSVKWLCGGPGVAYLYTRPDLLPELEPRLTGWMAHQRPFGFEPDMEYSQSAFRLLNGTPNIPGLYAARSGYQIIREVGVEQIRKKSLALTARILELCDENGFEVSSPRDPETRGGHVTVKPPRAEEVSRELLARRVMIDYRPDAGIRVAPHFYNTQDEVEAAMAEMRKIVDELGS